jgi:16S rRNA processing protein RimM
MVKDASRYQALGTVYVDQVPYEVERVWYHKEQPVFKLRGIDTISAAEQLAGKDVAIPAGDRVPLPEGEYYYSDLVGCRVVDNASGGLVGEVTGWRELGEETGKVRPVLLEVSLKEGGEPVLIPFAEAILKKIDVAAREIRADFPEGLLDLNR